MKVLVFGASGYIGSHVTRHLVQSGHRVTGFARNAASGVTVERLGATALIGDLDHTKSIAAMVGDHDAVIWAAQLMLEDEQRVVGALIEALAGSERVLIFTSGTSVMSIPTGGDWDERSFAEDEPFEPRRQIAPRLEIEQAVRDATQRGVRAMVVRPPMIWGNGGCRLISDFHHSARQTGAVCHIGRGLNVYSNVHVEDLAELYRLALDKGQPGALYFAVAGEVSYGVMARAIADTLGTGTRSVTVDEACTIWDRFMARIVLCSCSRQRSPRARAELGWRPREDRLDILDECRNPAYAQEGERSLPSWVRPGSG
ncbi:MAG TPA: NAD-dependent epimerase/dehydratase family protein [Novosphingobium sp.]|nr:NAD-dependent epimerase/dehydratase family protein [Novosphingobium sp.]